MEIPSIPSISDVQTPIKESVTSPQTTIHIPKGVLIPPACIIDSLYILFTYNLGVCIIAEEWRPAAPYTPCHSLMRRMFSQAHMVCTTACLQEHLVCKRSQHHLLALKIHYTTGIVTETSRTYQVSYSPKTNHSYARWTS